MADIRSKLVQARDLIQNGQYAPARDVLRRALQQSPRDRNAQVLMRFTLGRLGEHQQALYYAQEALRHDPADPNLLTNVANSLGECGREDEAIAMLSKVAAEHPAHAESRLSLGPALLRQLRLAEAAACCEQGLAARPGDPRLSAVLATASLMMGKPDDAILALRPVVAQTSDPEHCAQMANAYTYSATAAPADIFAAHAAYGRLIKQNLGPARRLESGPRDPGKRLRVGLLSPDLRQHASRWFLEGVLEHYDRRAMEIVCYYTSSIVDAGSERLRSLALRGGGLVELVGKTHEQIAERLRGDGLDIVIETCGHTQGESLAALQLRAAPIQISFLGYPNTTGLPEMDYRLVDALTDPPGTEKWNTERLLRVEGCHFCYRPPPGAPPVEAGPPSQREGSPTRGKIVFGTFTSLQKMNDRLARLWVRVLREVPGSVLLLKNSQLKVESTRELVRKRFAVNGLPADRLILEGPAAGAAELMGHYARIDVSLDTTPYCGVTSTCEALHMGVPVVTLAGERSAGRWGQSILHNSGLEELVAFTDDEFVRIAAGLAADGPRLAEYRRALREKFAASAVRDEKGYCERLERALRGAWAEYCDKTGPVGAQAAA